MQNPQLKLVSENSSEDEDKAVDVYALGMWRRANVPLRHAQNLMKTKGYDGWKKTLDFLIGRMGKGFVIVLHGSRGTGKTQLAVNAIYHACRCHHACRYTTAMDFFLQLRSTFRKDSDESERGILSELGGYGGPPERRIQFLVIDEAHERGKSEWENRQFTHIFDHRYRAKLDTLLITNEVAESAAESLGASITDRAYETGGFLECDWPSIRHQVSGQDR